MFDEFRLGKPHHLRCRWVLGWLSDDNASTV
jgi:hypothetical protein